MLITTPISIIPLHLHHARQIDQIGRYLSASSLFFGSAVFWGANRA
jgi:hypothetical protein